MRWCFLYVQRIDRYALHHHYDVTKYLQPSGASPTPGGGGSSATCVTPPNPKEGRRKLFVHHHHHYYYYYHHDYYYYYLETYIHASPTNTS